MRPPLLWMGVRVRIAATTAVASQTTRHESASYGMRVSCRGTATRRLAAGQLNTVWVCCCCRFAGVTPANSIRPIHEMSGAASASVGDLTPHGGITNSDWSGGVQKKVGGVNPPLGGVEKSLSRGSRVKKCVTHCHL